MLLDVIDIDVIHVCFHERVMVVAMVLPGAGQTGRREIANGVKDLSGACKSPPPEMSREGLLTYELSPDKKRPTGKEARSP